MPDPNSAPFDPILFDLDGTLTDPESGIVGSIRYAIVRMGLEDPGDQILRRFIGPPLRASFVEQFGLDDGEADRAIVLYREYFASRGLFENAVYPGIGDLLATLVRAGRTLALATAKPHVYATRILEHFGLRPHFRVIAGSELDGRRTDKGEVIAHALDGLGHPEPARTTMVGDRRHDVDGAHRCGLTAVAVTWGFGDREELAAAAPAHTVSDVGHLRRLLLGDPV